MNVNSYWEVNMVNKKVVIGVIVFFAILSLSMVYLGNLVKKEKNAETKSIEQNLIIVKEAKVLPENEGKLVLVNGETRRERVVVDDEFYMSYDSVKIYRKVEMVQWKLEETWNDRLEEYEYEYKLVWSEKHINNISRTSNENYINPSEAAYKSKTFYNDVEIGDFKLSSEQIKNIPTTGVIEKLDIEVADRIGMTITDKYYTNVKNGTPKKGDIRISFLVVDAKLYNEITILAKQFKDSFEDFNADNGTKAGKMTNKVYDGILSKSDVINDIKSEGSGYATMFYVIAGLFLIPIVFTIKNNFFKKI